MAEETPKEEQSENMTLYYVLGAIVVIVIAVGAYLLRPKSEPTTVPSVVTAPQTTETPITTPITGLTCEKQFYNPVVGFERYFLTAGGADVSDAKKVECTFTMSVGGKVVATDSGEGILEAAPSRNGQTFRCTTKQIDLKKNIPTKVDVSIKDDLGVTKTCSRVFQFP